MVRWGGHNWIHTELATGMHIQSSVECKCTCTLKQVHKNVIARAHSYAQTDTQTDGSERRTETMLGQAAESHFL